MNVTTGTPTFGVIDYTVFGLMLAISIGIGIYSSLRHNKSPEQFFMGDRNFSVIPVSMSMLASFVSAISLLGFTGETYAYGMQIVMYLVGTIFGIGTAALLVLPITYPLKMTSINEYIELRFKSTLLRKVITFLSVFTELIYMGVCLYAPTIALAYVTTLSSTTYIYILGFAVTLYSSIGGIRAVIWTDVFQLSVLLLGLLMIVIVGLWDVGGPANVWNVSLEGGRMEMFNMSFSIYERHTLLNTILFGFVANASFYGVSQANVQRVCSVPTYKHAKRVLLNSLFGMIIVYLLIFIAGIIGYTAYADCDPWIQGIIEKKEEIIPHYLMDRLHIVTGLPGLFVATITGGSLSSLSSALNAVVAMVWEDYCKDIKFFANLPPTTAGLITKVFSFVIGFVIVGIALMASNATNLVQFANTVMGAFFGGIFGVFVLGFLFPKTNMYGVWTGFICSMAFVTWMSCGSFLYGQTKNPLSLSVENCSSPTGFLNRSQTPIEDTFQNSDIFNDHNNYFEDFPLMYVYGISYTLYSSIGCISCILIALIVSLITGNEDVKNVNPLHVSPLLRKFYWGEDDLASQELEQTKPCLEVTLEGYVGGYVGGYVAADDLSSQELEETNTCLEVTERVGAKNGSNETALIHRNGEC